MKAQKQTKTNKANELALFNQEKSEMLMKVHQEGEMISLTDLWKEAGSPENKRPVIWERQDSTKQLIDVLGSMVQSDLKSLWKTKRGGTDSGTYAHKSIALAYAKYLDPKLHILVNQVFFERIEEEKNPDLIIDRAIYTYKKKGKDDKWIGARMNSKIKRNAFTSCLAGHGVTKDGFRNCTNAVYNGLYGGTSTVVREKKGLDLKANIRDNCSIVELASISLSEALSMEDIDNNNRHGNAQCEVSVSIATKNVAQAIVNSRKNFNTVSR